jgi:hypothetical protein
VRDLNRGIRWAVGIVICAAALTVIVLNVRTTIQDTAYFRMHGPPIPQGPFPIESLVGFCLLVVGEAAILWRLLTATWATAILRALAAFGLASVAAFIAFLTTQLHDPPRTFFHMMWLLGAAVIALTTLIVTGGISLVHRISSHPRGSG